MTLVIVIYLEQLIQKLKVFGGPFATFGLMRLCHGANPGGNSIKRVLSVCDELVPFCLFFATLCFSTLQFSISYSFFSFYRPKTQQYVFDLIMTFANVETSSLF